MDHVDIYIYMFTEPKMVHCKFSVGSTPVDPADGLPQPLLCMQCTARLFNPMVINLNKLFGPNFKAKKWETITPFTTWNLKLNCYCQSKLLWFSKSSYSDEAVETAGKKTRKQRHINQWKWPYIYCLHRWYNLYHR